VDIQSKILDSRVFQDLLGHSRHAAVISDVLVYSQPEGFVHVPLVQQDELSAAHLGPDDRRHATYVEKWTDDNVADCPGAFGARCEMMASRKLANAMFQILAMVALFVLTAPFGSPCGARRVKECDWVVPVESSDGKIVDRCALRQVGERDVTLAATNTDQTHSGGPAVIDDPLKSLTVHYGERGTRINKDVGKLRSGPPTVQRDDNAAGQRNAPEGDDELGEVAHRDGGSIAVTDAEGFLKLPCQAACLHMYIAECQRLVVVDDVHEVSMCDAHLEDFHDRAGCPNEVPQRNAVEADLLDLEWPTRSDEWAEPLILSVDRCNA
jgi:hypothetical protein